MRKSCHSHWGLRLAGAYQDEPEEGREEREERRMVGWEEKEGEKEAGREEGRESREKRNHNFSLVLLC